MENIKAFAGEKDEVQKGMDLRDYFADNILNGLLSSYVGAGDCIKAIEDKSEKLAKLAYKLADTMIKIRSEND